MRGGGRRLAGVAHSAAIGCGADGPVGTPGGREGLELQYATPRLRVVPAGEVQTVRIAIVVRRSVDGASEPLADARLVVEREEGRGRLSSTSAVTGPDGLASVDVLVPDAADRTRVVFRMESDRESFLPFDVVTTPVVDVDLAPGEVVDRLAIPKSGALLRFALDAGIDGLPTPRYDA